MAAAQSMVRNALKVQGAADDEHPLEWLQPTPPHSPDMMYLLPPCRARAVKEDGTSERRAEDMEAFRSRLTSSLRTPVPLPPQRTPPASVGVAASPLPPPPAGSPQVPGVEVPTAAPTREPSLEDSEDASPRSQLAAVFPSLATSHDAFSSPSSPGLLEAAGSSFLALSAWSTSVPTAVSRGEADEDVRRVAQFLRGGACEAQAAESCRRLGLPSPGSLQHELGRCKPCAFIYRPAGCKEDISCRFCHLCMPGEKKRRQKEKYEVVRLRRQCRRAKHAGLVQKTGAPPRP